MKLINFIIFFRLLFVINIEKHKTTFNIKRPYIKVLSNQSKYEIVPLKENTLERGHNNNENIRLILVTTYWITEKKIKHRYEIEMAMILNLHNKYISEVVVLLDNSVARDCSKLDRFLKTKGIQLNKRRNSKFTCVPRPGYQQSGYYDLFNYSKRFYDEIVIVSNADQVFDVSVNISRRLRRGHLIVLATRGFSSHASENLKEYYPKKYHPKIRSITDRCYRDKKRSSWDSYIFRPREISNAIQPQYFRVDGWKNDTRENETLFMNVMGAENKALGIIKKYAPNIKMYQGCDFIRSWHFHQYKKTHYKKKWPRFKNTRGIWSVPDMTNKTFRSVFYPVNSEQEPIPVNEMNMSLNSLYSNVDFRNRELIDTKPLFKLDAYCINLKSKPQNVDFIRYEWKDFLNVKRIIALETATASHYQLFRTIWADRETLKFPIVVMEDDVFRRKNFTKYWNELKNIKDVDYVAFDAFFLKLSPKEKQSNKFFLRLLKHRAMGFTVYYKHFFERFESVEDMPSIFPIDMEFTHNSIYIKLTPREQVTRQIVSKKSTTNYKFTNNYLRYYEIAEKTLQFKKN